jgi:hypothetical protein
MAGMKDLMREYERARFPPDRRLDLHGEGPSIARERALQWIRSRAHEAPGQELLVIVDRGTRRRGPSAIEASVRELLEELDGRLIDWWQPFAPGSLAFKVSSSPNVVPIPSGAPPPAGEGRTPETAGSARPPVRADIPPDLLPALTRAAELRLDREELSARLLDVVLREVWYEAQAMAMERRISFEEAAESIGRREASKRDHSG